MRRSGRSSRRVTWGKKRKQETQKNNREINAGARNTDHTAGVEKAEDGKAESRENNKQRIFKKPLLRTKDGRLEKIVENQERGAGSDRRQQSSRIVRVVSCW